MQWGQILPSFYKSEVSVSILRSGYLETAQPGQFVQTGLPSIFA